MENNSKILEFEKIVSDMRVDFDKFFIKNNKSAGVRIRKNLQNLKIFSQKLRVEILKKTKELSKEQDL